MGYNPEFHNRKSIRLRKYDYAKEGLYFITLCTNHHECLFGEIENGVMRLNEFGQIAEKEWVKSAFIRNEIEIDCFVIMPNHIHGIVFLNEHCRGDRPVAQNDIDEPLIFSPFGNLPDVTGNITDNISDRGDQPVAPTANAADLFRPKGPKSKSIGSFIAGYKSTVTLQINLMRKLPGFPVWQRNYYDHIIRNESSHKTIADYIQENPKRWGKDKFYRK